MNQIEFVALQAKCITVLDLYFAEARKTSSMLKKCTSEPLPFRERVAILSQEIVEKDAHLLYLEAKRLLHSAALLGYGALAKDSSPAAMLALLKG